MDDDIHNVGISTWVQSTEYHELLTAIDRCNHLSQLQSETNRQGEGRGINSIEREVRA